MHGLQVVFPFNYHSPALSLNSSAITLRQLVRPQGAFILMREARAAPVLGSVCRGASGLDGPYRFADLILMFSCRKFHLRRKPKA